MIESIENAIQIATLLVCASAALYMAYKKSSHNWTFLFFFYGSVMMGDIYWVVYLVFLHRNPSTDFVPDLSWLASYIFLYLMIKHLYPKEIKSKISFLPWLGPVFTAGMAVFFMQWDGIFRNVVYAALDGLLLFSAIRVLTDLHISKNRRWLPWQILIYCLFEYGSWVASCFWDADSLTNPYYWFDFLMTVSFLFFLPATEKAVAE